MKKALKYLSIFVVGVVTLLAIASLFLGILFYLIFVKFYPSTNLKTTNILTINNRTLQNEVGDISLDYSNSKWGNNAVIVSPNYQNLAILLKTKAGEAGIIILNLNDLSYKITKTNYKIDDFYWSCNNELFISSANNNTWVSFDTNLNTTKTFNANFTKGNICVHPQDEVYLNSFKSYHKDYLRLSDDRHWNTTIKNNNYKFRHNVFSVNCGLNCPPYGGQFSFLALYKNSKLLGTLVTIDPLGDVGSDDPNQLNTLLFGNTWLQDNSLMYVNIEQNKLLSDEVTLKVNRVYPKRLNIITTFNNWLSNNSLKIFAIIAFFGK